ncbi:MotA/TolQ/ExbB proton channel family protein [Oscillatoria sp. CS-180]|nr:MotA/TolQ/ExbB proton channel family protein [Oscillatoria sp. CS-180]MDB9527101.1 MotA/TolQ/ExbB proton channel family protein [Oscillatoria sp. CS-180]
MGNVTGSLVTLLLLATSLVGMTLIFERLWFWNRISKRQKKLVRAVLDSYEQQPQAALSKLKKNSDLPIARIFLAALTTPDATPEDFRIALESSAQGELPLFQRFSAALNTIVGIAPLLGLLGTILGLMKSLSALDIGAGNSDRTLDVISGIGEALITTALGLIIAIATLIFANVFQGLYRQQRAFIQETGGQLELLYRRQHRQTTRRPYDPTRTTFQQPYSKS